MSRVLATATFALLAGCGYIGPPLPPALHVPKPVLDLQAEQIGDRILVRFTPPKLTTEDLPAELRAITLYAGPSEGEFSRERWAATAVPHQVPVTATEFPLGAADWVGKQLVVYVRTTGRTGRESDWSNRGTLVVGTPLRVPDNVVIMNMRDGISLKWTGNAPRYRVLRSVEGKLEPIGETDAPEYVDHAVVYGVSYEYVIVGLGDANQQSLRSAPNSLTAKDEFSPAVPTGPTAVANGLSVDLSWTRSSDDDLAGYNIFRAVADGPFEPLEQRIPLPAYTDTHVESGKRYRYRVSAVDTAGNQSDQSVEAVAQVE